MIKFYQSEDDGMAASLEGSLLYDDKIGAYPPGFLGICVKKHTRKLRSFALHFIGRMI